MLLILLSSTARSNVTYSILLLVSIRINSCVIYIIIASIHISVVVIIIIRSISIHIVLRRQQTGRVALRRVGGLPYILSYIQLIFKPTAYSRITYISMSLSLYIYRYIYIYIHIVYCILILLYDII